MLKRFALMVAATAVLAVPASSAFGAQTNGALPRDACFAAYPEVVQPAFCGEGTGGPGGH